MSQIAKRLVELAIVLPKPAALVANDLPCALTGGAAPGASCVVGAARLPADTPAEVEALFGISS